MIADSLIIILVSCSAVGASAAFINAARHGSRYERSRPDTAKGIVK